MTEIDQGARDAALRRSLDEPMPRDLTRQIADLIEPQTMNAQIPHGEVMTCIQIAFPAIRDYLAGEQP